jgi:hypothetical protein
MKMFELKYEITSGNLVRAVITKTDGPYPYVVWVGEVAVANVPKLVRLANKELKIAKESTK